MPGVTIYSSENNAVNTDENGHYDLKLDAGTHVIKIRFIGYKEILETVSVVAGDTKRLDFVIENQSTELGTVVVSAGKFEQKLAEVTVSMDVITTVNIERMADNTVESILQQVSGISMLDGQANIRGGSGFSYGAGSRVLVLVDDMPMLSADANDAKWSFLPIENLQQIEIIKGASSALYGSAAMNGVINFRTGYAKSEPITRFTHTSGIYDAPARSEIKWWNKSAQLMSSGNFFHAQKFGQFDLVLGGHYLMDDGYRKGETETRARANVNARYRFKKAEGLSTGINANYMETFGGLFIIWNDDSTGTYIPSGGVDDTNSTLSNYHTIRYNVDPFVTYATKSGFTAKARTRFFKTDNHNDSEQEAFAELYYGELQLQQRIEKWNFTVTAGATATNGWVGSDLYGSRKDYNKAVFLQADKKFWNRLSLSAGGRWEEFRFRDDKPESKPVFRAGANMRVFKATYFRGSFGQGYRFPSIAEKFTKTHVGNIVIYPNDSVTSETGWAAEIGLRQEFKFRNAVEGYIDAAVFRNRYTNMLEFAFGSYGDPLKDPSYGLGFKSVNIGNTQIDGIEFELGIKINITKNLNLQLGGGYTYIEPIMTDFDTLKAQTGTVPFNILKYRSRNLFKGNGQIEYKNVAFAMTSRYNSFMQNIDVVFNELLPGVKRYRTEHDNGDWVYDARLSYKLNKNINVAFIARNLFNHEYADRPADVGPPRTWIFQFTLIN